MTVTLRPITKDNYKDCIRLKVASGQENFVAPNVFSLAQAAYEPHVLPLAIYEAETMVGFVMAQHLSDKGIPFIWRLMVDAEHQGKGYGKAGIQQMVERLKAMPGCQRIGISYMPDNETARQLYLALGFVETGEMDEDEVVAYLQVDSSESDSP
jgi:diamine N-acetyltransferase